MTMAPLRQLLHDADPAAGTITYSAGRQAAIIARVLAESQVAEPLDVASAPTLAGPGGHRVRPVRRRVRLAIAAALTAASTAAAGAVLLPDHAVAAQMDRLAATAAGPVPAHQYLYTKTRTVQVGGTAKPQPDDRRWNTETDRAWQGDTCNDRLDIVWGPARFFSAADEQALRAQVSRRDFVREVTGWSASSRGRELRALDDVPCTETGTFQRPNPPYAATYPSDPAAFLAKAVRDSGARAGQADNTPADAVLEMLGLPYLSAAQRSAALRAFGMAAGEWTASGHATVAGVRGVVIRRDLGPVEQELVIGSQAPGLLRSVLQITNSARATEFDPRYAGLGAGTVVYQKELLAVSIVPTLDTAPR